MITQDKENLLLFFDSKEPFQYNNSWRTSTLMAGLAECRSHTQRDAKTGEYDPGLPHGFPGHWLGAIGYFTILDQFGSCYKKKDFREPSKKENCIRYSIENFGFDLIGKDENKLFALVALRNAFTHDFNLLNIPQHHKFIVNCNVEDNFIVKTPARIWDGDVGRKIFMTNPTQLLSIFLD